MNEIKYIDKGRVLSGFVFVVKHAYKCNSL